MSNSQLLPNLPIHIMLDLETLGTKPGCKILSIGACTFNPYGFERFPRQEIYLKLDPEKGQILLHENEDTINWWKKQSETAKKDAFSGKLDLLSACSAFNNWLDSLKSLYKTQEIHIWGNGKDFDEPILEEAFFVAGIKPIWNRENSYCFRHMKSDRVYHEIKKFPFVGTVHNALYDAIHQADWAEKICTVLRADGNLESGLKKYHECMPYGGF